MRRISRNVSRVSPVAVVGACLLCFGPSTVGCVPAGGGGGGDGDPVVVGQEPEPEGGETDPALEPVEVPPEEPIEPAVPVAGPQACLDADADWPDGWRLFEDAVVEQVNLRRAEGADCGSQGVWDPTHPLASDEQLRCAARLHSRDMGERGYFDHLDPEGVDPGVRIQAAEYHGLPGGENIAAGARTPDEVVEGWMGSDGHCANIMRPEFDEIGVGYAEVPGSPWRIYWTQTFGFAR